MSASGIGAREPGLLCWGVCRNYKGISNGKNNGNDIILVVLQYRVYVGLHYGRIIEKTMEATSA